MSQARKSGQDDSVKSSLVFFSDILEADLKKIAQKPLIFSDFIYDQGMIFKTIDSKTDSVGVDVEVHTNGLLAQMLESIGVVDYQKIADGLKNAIESLHAQLSKGNTNSVEEQKKLKDTIDTIRVVVQ